MNIEQYNGLVILKFDDNQNGNFGVNAPVKVLNDGGGTATIYSDKAGTSLQNPFNSGDMGQFSFFAVAGYYELVINEGTQEEYKEKIQVGNTTENVITINNAEAGNIGKLPLVPTDLNTVRNPGFFADNSGLSIVNLISNVATKGGQIGIEPTGNIKFRALDNNVFSDWQNILFSNNRDGFAVDALLTELENNTIPQVDVNTQNINDNTNEINKLWINQLNTVIPFLTLDDWLSSATVKEGDQVSIAERTTGKGGGFIGDVIAGTGTANGKTIIAHNTFNFSLKLRKTILNSDKQAADTPDKFCGWLPLEPSYINDLKDIADITSDSDGVTVNNKSLKAWNYPRGIKDGAVAGSFIINNGITEPSTQVTGFNNLADIGTFSGRDAVALFAQAESAPALVITSNTVYTATSVQSNDFITDWDRIDVGMMVEVNFPTASWVSGVITGKVSPSTLQILEWRKVDGTSDPAPTPINGESATVNIHNNIWAANFNVLIDDNNDGANQGIGIETGTILLKPGSSINSRGYYVVNLAGEAPEFAFIMAGLFQKGYTSKDCTVYGFSSTDDLVGYVCNSPTNNSFESENPGGNHLECRDSSSSSQVIIRNDGKVVIGKNAESGQARLSLRGDGSFSSTYNETEFGIYDPTTPLSDRKGFFISHDYPASTASGNFVLGVGNSNNHVYSMKFQTQNTDRMIFTSGGDIGSGVDNTQKLGTPSNRWSEIFAGNGTINTSDERLKTFREEFSNKEKAVALELKSILSSFNWNESIERQEAGGKKARIHIGIGAQSLAKAFENQGLNANDYAMFCYDEWEDEITAVQTNIGKTHTEEKRTELQVTEKKEFTEYKESFSIVDGKHVLTKTPITIVKDVPIFDTFDVYDNEGNLVYETNMVGGKAVKRVKTRTLPRMEVKTEEIEVPDEPIIKEVVTTKAGSRYGIRLNQVLAFILANT